MEPSHESPGNREEGERQRTASRHPGGEHNGRSGLFGDQSDSAQIRRHADDGGHAPGRGGNRQQKQQARPVRAPNGL
jgi:hypothetical protein